MDRELKQALKLYGPAAVLVLIAFIVAYQFIKPAPPDHVRIASGGPQGAYYHYAQAYARELAKEGITLEVVQTAGSVENIRLLGQGKVDIALVQGGIPDDSPGPALYSLGSLYYEPLWWFARRDLALDDLRALRGLRVATGGEGSGTRALVLRLLAENGIDANNATLIATSSGDAAARLRRGELDAAFFVTSPASPLIQELLRAPDVQLLSFRRAEAYARRHRFLTGVPLPEGVADLRDNLPPHDVQLLAPAANLVVSEHVHPAINDLLLQVIERVHRAGDWFAAYGEFPRPDLLAWPLAPEAQRYYEHGPPFLQRYLPFWAASLIDRLKVMLLPLILMLLPLFKAIPPLVDWRMASKIYRWYDDLAQVDDTLVDATPEQREAALAELKRIEGEVRQIEVPLSYARRLYHLRQHIDLVRRRALSDRIA
jgi:TRAP transporter TAXI family solute receptor